MDEYKYFVSYSYTKSGNSFGFGNCDVIRSRKFRGATDSKTIAEQIAKDMGLPVGSVIILFVQFVERV